MNHSLHLSLLLPGNLLGENLLGRRVSSTLNIALLSSQSSLPMRHCRLGCAFDLTIQNPGFHNRAELIDESDAHRYFRRLIQNRCRGSFSQSNCSSQQQHWTTNDVFERWAHPNRLNRATTGAF